MDLLIAATAHAHSSRLYTRNPDDFTGLHELIEVVSVWNYAAWRNARHVVLHGIAYHFGISDERLIEIDHY